VGPSIILQLLRPQWSVTDIALPLLLYYYHAPSSSGVGVAVTLRIYMSTMLLYLTAQKK
jgi:hypothetical protein